MFFSAQNDGEDEYDFDYDRGDHNKNARKSHSSRREPESFEEEEDDDEVEESEEFPVQPSRKPGTIKGRIPTFSPMTSVNYSNQEISALELRTSKDSVLDRAQSVLSKYSANNRNKAPDSNTNFKQKKLSNAYNEDDISISMDENEESNTMDMDDDDLSDSRPKKTSASKTNPTAASSLKPPLGNSKANTNQATNTAMKTNTTATNKPTTTNRQNVHVSFQNDDEIEEEYSDEGFDNEEELDESLAKDESIDQSAEVPSKQEEEESIYENTSYSRINYGNEDEDDDDDIEDDAEIAVSKQNILSFAEMHAQTGYNPETAIQSKENYDDDDDDIEEISHSQSLPALPANDKLQQIPANKESTPSTGLSRTSSVSKIEPVATIKTNNSTIAANSSKNSSSTSASDTKKSLPNSTGAGNANNIATTSSTTTTKPIIKTTAPSHELPTNKQETKLTTGTTPTHAISNPTVTVENNQERPQQMNTIQQPSVPQAEYHQYNPLSQLTQSYYPNQSSQQPQQQQQQQPTAPATTPATTTIPTAYGYPPSYQPPYGYPPQYPPATTAAPHYYPPPPSTENNLGAAGYPPPPHHPPHHHQSLYQHPYHQPYPYDPRYQYPPPPGHPMYPYANPYTPYPPPAALPPYPPYPYYPASYHPYSMPGQPSLPPTITSQSSSLSKASEILIRDPNTSPVVVDLLIELNKAQEEAMWAKKKLAETMMLLKEEKSHPTTIVKPLSPANKQVPVMSTISKLQTQQVHPITKNNLPTKVGSAPEKTNDSDEDEYADEEYEDENSTSYSEDFEVSKLNLSSSVVHTTNNNRYADNNNASYKSSPSKSPGRSPGRSTNKSSPAVATVRPSYSNTDPVAQTNFQNGNDNVNHQTMLANQGSLSSKPSVFSTDPMSDSLLRSFLASQELLRAKIDSLRLRVQMTSTMAADRQYMEDMISNTRSFTKSTPSLSEIKQHFADRRSISEMKIEQVLRENYPDINPIEIQKIINKYQS